MGNQVCQESAEKKGSPEWMESQVKWVPLVSLGPLGFLVLWVCQVNMAFQALKVKLDQVGLRGYQVCVGTKGLAVLWGSQGFLGSEDCLDHKGCLAQWAPRGKVDLLVSLGSQGLQGP